MNKFKSYIESILKKKSAQKESLSKDDSFPLKKVKEPEVFQFTPRNIVAGRLPHAKGLEKDSVYHAAESLLNCGQVKFIYSVHDGFVYWIAAPSSEFGNNIESASPIEAALPGSKEHHGDGAYIVQVSQNLSIVIIKNERGLVSYSGPSSMVAKFNAQEGNDDVFYPTQGQKIWSSLGDAERKRTQQLFKYSAALGLLLNIAAFAVWIGSSVYEGRQNDRLSALVEKQNVSVGNLVRSLNTKTVKNPVMMEHAQLVKFVSTAYNGRIINFNYENGSTSWKIEIPSWTPQEELAQLGQGIQIEEMPNGRMIVEKASGNGSRGAQRNARRPS